MLGRIRDALHTLFFGLDGRLLRIERENEARVRQLEGEARAVLVELSGGLEKLTAWHAREIKRQYRNQKRADAEKEEAAAEVASGPARSRKAELWARARARGLAGGIPSQRHLDLDEVAEQ